MSSTFNEWLDELSENLHPGSAKTNAFASVLRHGPKAPLRDIQILADALGLDLRITVKPLTEPKEPK